jgi:ParB-like chromosome segregation protein Spo0J
MGQIRVADIRLEGEGWDAYLVRHRASAARIEESVRHSGVILPVVLEEWREGYRVISGFGRALAAKAAGTAEIPAMIFEEQTLAARDAYLMALAANAPGEGLNDADRAAALAKGKSVFGLDEEELVRTAAPMLGLAASHKVVREYLEISELPAAVLDALAEGRISRQHAEGIVLVAARDREWFWREAVEALRLSASEARVFAGGALDLAAREGLGLREVLGEVLAGAGGAAKGDAAGALAGRRAAARAGLERRLSPILGEMEDEFDALAKGLNLPGGAKVEHAGGFEKDELTITARAGDAAAIRALEEALERGLAEGIFERMLSIARRKADEMSAKMRGAEK